MIKDYIIASGFQQVNNIRPFYGYDYLSLGGDSYLKLNLKLDYEIFKKQPANPIHN